MIISNTDTENFVAEKLYKRLENERDSYVDRAKDCAKITLPQLFPPDGSDFNTRYPTPYQSIGARGVNNLANKIILSLFPPNSAFFKMGINPSDREALGVSQGDVEKSMYAIEDAIIAEMEASGLRPKLIQAMKQGIVGGSVLLYIPDVGAPEVHRMDSFVIRRSKKGDILQLVLKESIYYNELEESIKGSLKDLDENVLNGEKPLDLYTVIISESPDVFVTWQEIKGVIVDGTTGQWSKRKVPYIFVPFNDTGENYGRSYTEDFYGDLLSYEGLRKSVLEASAEAARILYLLKPNATAKLKSVQNAKSGDVITGNPEDITVLQANKSPDLQITQAEADVLRMDLASVFLLDSSVRRSAERVTAEEIRRVAQELEVALGGIYSTLSNNLQEPLVRLYMNRLIKAGKLDDVFEESVEYSITTGSSALGRGSDYQTLTTFVQTLIQIIPVESLGSIIEMPEFIRRIAYSLDVNTASLIKTEQQVMEEQQAAQQAALQQQVAPEVAKAELQQQ